MREPLQPKRLIAPAIFVLLVFGALLWRRPVADSGPQVQRYSGSTMCTTWSVLVAGQADPELSLAIQAELDEVDGRMSTWKEDSELSLLNAAERSSPLSPPTLEVLGLARQVWLESGGAFDVTIGPLVNAYGFGPGGEAGLTEAEVEAMRAAFIGQDKLQLEASGATKADPRVFVDLSAIAKGYAVDLVSEELSERGYPDHMVEVGGEIRVAGLKAPETPWTLAIEAPIEGQRGQVQRQLQVTDTSLATSGDYRNFKFIDGDRVSHTIDPRTGSPIEHDLASVSVLHERCVLADAYATAINVLGPEEGWALAEELDLEVLLIVRNEDGSFTEKGRGRFAQ